MYGIYVSILEVLLSQFEWNSRDLPTETRLTDCTDSLSFVTPANFPRTVTVRRMANDVTYTFCVVYFKTFVSVQSLFCCALECVYCECLYLSLHSERDHPSSPSSTRPESEYAPPPVYQPPEVTRSTLQPPRKHNLDYLTSNPAYNLSTSLREELLNDETCSNFNGAYGVSPVNLNLSRLRPAPPGNPPPVYYDN